MSDIKTCKKCKFFLLLYSSRGKFTYWLHAGKHSQNDTMLGKNL